MMNFLQKIHPEWILRLGLGFMYLYSGSNLMTYPSGWIWAIPWWLRKIVETYTSLESYLRFQGGVEFLMALIFLAWFLPRRFVFLAALVSSVELAFILLFAPLFSVTFRDLGVLGAALALLLISFNRQSSKSDIN